MRWYRISSHLATVSRYRHPRRVVHDGPVVLHPAGADARLHAHGIAGAHPNGEAQPAEDDFVGGCALLRRPLVRQNFWAPGHGHQQVLHSDCMLDAVVGRVEGANEIALLHLHRVAVVKCELTTDLSTNMHQT